jgi:hypothetical protein
MVDTVKSMAARAGAVCYADPFLPSTENSDEGIFLRALSWLPLPTASSRHRIATAGRQKRLLSYDGARTPVRAVG